MKGIQRTKPANSKAFPPCPTSLPFPPFNALAFFNHASQSVLDDEVEAVRLRWSMGGEGNSSSLEKEEKCRCLCCRLIVGTPIRTGKLGLAGIVGGKWARPSSNRGRILVWCSVNVASCVMWTTL